MVIYRLAPGEVAPWAGQYALVAEWGESLGFAIQCDAGERLPSITAAEAESAWYVLVGEQIPNEIAQAA